MSLSEAPWAAVRTFIQLGARVAERPARPFLPLDAMRLVDVARRRAGVQEVEDVSFLEGLRVLVGSLETEARLNLMGRIAVREDITRLLANRFRIERDCQRDPGIAAEEIHRPIFITGMPRSGSTLLHGLLAQDPASRVPRTWEMLLPSPAPERATYDSDPRIAKVERELRWFKRLTPDFQAIHDVGARMPEECTIIIAHSFVSSQFTSMYDVPSYARWCDAQDPRTKYEWHRRFLQHLQRRFGAERWVLKAPAHLNGLAGLLSVYPDARVVMTHRDPVEVVASEASLIATLRRTFTTTVDPVAVGREVTQCMEDDIRLGLKARDAGLVSPTQFFDVVYSDVLHDAMGVVRRMYDHFDLPLTPPIAARMRRFLAENPKEKHGSHRYALAQFGFDPDEERQRYRAYRERFLGKRPETPSRVGGERD
jgi:Sulfotransferase family